MDCHIFSVFLEKLGIDYNELMTPRILRIKNMHNTRLFPKGKGAESYRLTGIAALCDWAIMTDSHQSDVSVRGDLSKPPRTVFFPYGRFSTPFLIFLKKSCQK